jgi:hypothetical protein
MLEMLVRHIQMIGDERAAGAHMVRARRQHEMKDGELAPAAEQVTERACTLRSFEDIRLLDLDPRHLPALGAERVEFRARSLARSALRASSHSSRETIAWFMVNLL